MANLEEHSYSSMKMDRLESIRLTAYDQMTKWSDRLTDVIEYIKIWSVEHPLLAVFILILLLTTSVPILIFASFVVSVVLFGIIGFAFIEGLLLTTSTAVLLTIVGFAATAALGITGFIISLYFCMHFAYHLLGITKDTVRHGYNGVTTMLCKTKSVNANECKENEEEETKKY